MRMNADSKLRREPLTPSSALLSKVPAAICSSNQAPAAAGSFCAHACKVPEMRYSIERGFHQAAALQQLERRCGVFPGHGIKKCPLQILADFGREIEGCDFIERGDDFIGAHRIHPLTEAHRLSRVRHCAGEVTARHHRVALEMGAELGPLDDLAAFFQRVGSRG